MLRRYILAGLGASLALLALDCGGPPARPSAPTLAPAAAGPEIQREFRGVWVATVANIDWPSAPGLSAAQQQSEARLLLDLAAAVGLNAVILQVRPQCDALYASKLEPWSHFLTGRQGQAPVPLYDPLAFWIDEAHARGLELHAWLNPFRAHHPSGGRPNDASIVRRRPELVVELAGGYYWLNPASGAAQDHAYAVVMDIVRRYDVDGIHFDDYFYPYPSDNANRDFPDEASWQDYRRRGGRLSRSDWRRDHVNRFVHRVYTGIRREKPGAKFGISPFGIWRPGHPASVRGLDAYEVLAADALLWLAAGWVDYLAPQLYWPTRAMERSFPVLLGWWVRQNASGRHVWPGLMTSEIEDERGVDENVSQIMIARGFAPEAPGHVHFSMKALREDRHGLVAALRAGPYARPALVPPSPWLGARPPAAPLVFVRPAPTGLLVRWQHDRPGTVFRWVVAFQRRGRWEYELCPGAQASLALRVDVPGAAGNAAGSGGAAGDAASRRAGAGGTGSTGSAAAGGTAPPPERLQADAGTPVLVYAVDRLGNLSAPGAARDR